MRGYRDHHCRAEEVPRDRFPLTGTYTLLYPDELRRRSGNRHPTTWHAPPGRRRRPADLPEAQHSEHLWLRPGESPPVGETRPNATASFEEIAWSG